MRWLLAEVDPGSGRMGVEDPNSAAEAPFHKFLALDAAPTAWSCTAFASGVAAIQARARRAAQPSRAGAQPAQPRARARARPLLRGTGAEQRTRELKRDTQARAR